MGEKIPTGRGSQRNTLVAVVIIVLLVFAIGYGSFRLGTNYARDDIIAQVTKPYQEDYVFQVSQFRQDLQQLMEEYGRFDTIEASVDAVTDRFDERLAEFEDSLNVRLTEISEELQDEVRLMVEAGTSADRQTYIDALQEFQADLASFETRVTEQRDQLASSAASAAVQPTVDRLEGLQETLAAVQAEQASSAAVLAAVQAEQAAAAEALTAQASQPVPGIAELREDVGRFNEQINEQVSGLEGAMDQRMAAEFSVLREDLERLAEQVTPAADPSEELQDLSTHLAALQETLAAVQAEQASSAAVLAAVQAEQTSVAQALAAQESRPIPGIAELREDIERLAEQMTPVVDPSEELQDLSTHLAALQETLAAVQAEQASSAAVLAAVQAEQTSAAQALAAQESRSIPGIAELREDVSRLNEQLGSLEGAMDTRMAGEFVILSEEIERLAAQIAPADASVELQELSTQLVVLQESLAALQSGQTVAVEVLKELQANLSQWVTSTDEEPVDLTAPPDPNAAPVNNMAAETATEFEMLYVGDMRVARLRLIRGDNIWMLARRFEEPPSPQFVQEILRLNDIQDPRRLQIGQTVLIPVRD